MAGVKGRSGRKGWEKEIQSKELWELSTGILIKALKAEDTEVSFERKIQISQAVALRMVPNGQTSDEEDGANRPALIKIIERVSKKEVATIEVGGNRVAAMLGEDFVSEVTKSDGQPAS